MSLLDRALMMQCVIHPCPPLSRRLAISRSSEGQPELLSEDDVDILLFYLGWIFSMSKKTVLL